MYEWTRGVREKERAKEREREHARMTISMILTTMMFMMMNTDGGGAAAEDFTRLYCATTTREISVHQSFSSLPDYNPRTRVRAIKGGLYEDRKMGLSSLHMNAVQFQDAISTTINRLILQCTPSK